MPKKRSNAAESKPPEGQAAAEEMSPSEANVEDTVSEPVAEEEQEDRSEQLERQVGELQDQLLRKQADFENYRKRMAREKEETARFANSGLLSDLMEVIDDFERAIRSSEESKDYDSFHEGIAMIERQLVSTLEKKWGLARYDSTGEPFDPEIHQAIAAEEREDHEESIVLEEFQKGYKLHDRVLRPAAVKVSTPTAGADQAADKD